MIRCAPIPLVMHMLHRSAIRIPENDAFLSHNGIKKQLPNLPTQTAIFISILGISAKRELQRERQTLEERQFSEVS